MRLIIDAVGITSSGGAAVLESLVDGLTASRPEFEIQVCLLPRARRAFEPRSMPARVTYRIVDGAATLPGRILWQQFRLPLLCRREGASVVLSLVNVGARFPSVAQVVYCHQALPFFSTREVQFTPLRRLRNFVMKRFILAGMKSSAAIIFQTAAMRRAVLEQAGLAAERGHTIYPGPPRPAMVADGNARWIARLEEFRRRRSPAAMYLTHPAEHKNPEVLLDAATLLKRRGLDFLLALTMDPDIRQGRYGRLVASYSARAERLGIDDRLFWTGLLPEAAVPPFLGATDLFVFPSLVESCPMALLQAMQSGTPLLLADRPYARELAGAAAEFFDPKDPDDLAARLLSILSSPARRSSLARASAERGRAFSWPAAALKIGDLLRVAGRRPRGSEGKA